MFDIGGPEFLVIAIVALVVLGPERLPEVMRRAGVFYRQARQMLNEYTGEAQRMFEEGMREVNDVSNTISSTWQDATTEHTPDTPPPALLQLPPPLLAPDKAANAGPWTLAAWYRDTRADIEPQPAGHAESPFTLAAARPERDLFDDFGIGSPSLMGPAPLDEEDGPLEHVDHDERGAVSPIAVPTLEDGHALQPEAVPASAGAALPEPALGVTDEGRLFQSEEHATVAPVNGKLHRVGEATDPSTVRQETVIELYRIGDITLEKAAEFLGITPGQFRGLLRRK